MFEARELAILRGKIGAMKEPVSRVPGQHKPVPNVLYDRESLLLLFVLRAVELIWTDEGLQMWMREKESLEYEKYLPPDDAGLCVLCEEEIAELFIKSCKHYFCESCFDDNLAREYMDDVEVSFTRGNFLLFTYPIDLGFLLPSRRLPNSVQTCGN
jgi:hypothetical protein